MERMSALSPVSRISPTHSISRISWILGLLVSSYSVSAQQIGPCGAVDWPSQLNRYGSTTQDPCFVFWSLWTTVSSTTQGVDPPVGLGWGPALVIEQSDSMVPGEPQGETFYPTNPFTCTEVAYNALSACTACQDGISDSSRWKTHEAYFAHCQGVPPLESFPDSAIQPPPWMTNTYPTTFNVTAAVNIVDPGAVLSTVRSSATTGISGGSGAAPSPVATVGGDSSSAMSASSGLSSGLSKGAFIGIIVGSVVGVFLIGCLLFFLLRRRQRGRVAPSSEFMKYARDDKPGATAPLNRDEEGAGPFSLPADERAQSGSGDDDIQEVEAPPPFTPGLFKDPVFEKGAALNLGLSPSRTDLHAPASSSSPTYYSPITPSTASHVAPERQRLISKRPGSSG